MHQEAKTLRSNDQSHTGLFGLQQDVSTQYSSMIETSVTKPGPSTSSDSISWVAMMDCLVGSSRVDKKQYLNLGIFGSADIKRSGL